MHIYWDAKGKWEKLKQQHTNKIKFIKYLRPTVMIIDDHIFVHLFTEEGIEYKV